MEEVHGVDVSWLHHPHKDKTHPRRSSAGSRRDAKAPTSTTQPAKSPPPSDPNTPSAPSNLTPPAPAPPKKDTTTAIPSTPTPPSSIGKTPPKRPGLLKPNSEDGKSGSRRPSWMTSISSKFSSTPERPGAATPPPLNGVSPPASDRASRSLEEVEEEEGPYVPSKPKDSFFSSLTRRLSSGASQNGGNAKVPGYGGVCARRVLNVDPNRERCLVPEMDPSRLRRVSFCVDVEIAGGPRYLEDEDDQERTKKKQDFKLKERAEGEALKHPEAVKDKLEDGEPILANKAKAQIIPGKEEKDTLNKDQDENRSPTDSIDDNGAAARKREKKKRSEEERRERKEHRRRRAEESGAIPVELSMDGEDDSTMASSLGHPPLQQPAPTSSTKVVPEPGMLPLPQKEAPLQTQPKPQQPQPSAGKQDRPTTDPVRIYRRCCQLRESPILKRITEQLSSPTCVLPQDPGVVDCLNLTGSRLQVADVSTLGDWLAVVPVKKLILEDADLNDEGVRCILAGLLAAKKPEPTKRRSTNPRHRESLQAKFREERSGVIDKISLKNNPRISRTGWKHISMFLYMCKSLKAIDVSMNQFPSTLPPSAQVTPIKSPNSAPVGKGQDIDAAECLYKCLSERRGGSRLEELVISECGLGASQIRKIVDGAIICGIGRVGLAGNHLDDEGLQHVMTYLRSGVCHGLDIGGNDLRGKLGVLADTFNEMPELPCWGLGLAGCNLDSASLRPLFAAIQKLPNFRFMDLSHNRDLCSHGKDHTTISLLRRYIGQMSGLKRLHLADVGMSPKQAIALADVLPEGPQLAHLSLLENPQLTALANAKTEAEQEEACALYASLMAAVRVSSTLICIDIDVPSQDNSEVVKALAKQVVAYSLRNMEQFAIAEATGTTSTANATTKLTSAYGGEQSIKDFAVPDILMHLVGHMDGNPVNHDNDEPAPDEDYIVGGTGVVKALQYVLGEKANDLRRTSLPATPRSGSGTPDRRPGSSTGVTEAQRFKAKKMSQDLLGSARKIRMRLQPALVKEATAGDEMAYRRLLFLDQTLQSMIQRFEEEFPETRISVPGAIEAEVGRSSEDSSVTDQSNALGVSVKRNTEVVAKNESDDEGSLEFDDHDAHIKPTPSRHNSDVSLAARALSMEEGHLHRIGQHMRREVIDSPRSATEASGASLPPWRQAAEESERDRIRALGERIEAISGPEMKHMVEREGWQETLRQLGGNFEDLRALQEQDPEAWEMFRESQLKARLNVHRDRPGSAGLLPLNGEGEAAVE